MLRFLYFMIFPVMLVYPNGLLANTYLNYIYVVFVFICFLVFERGNKFYFTIVNSFFFFLFLIILFANLWSMLINTSIPEFNYIASTFRYLSYFFIAHILVNTTQNSRQFRFWVISFFVAFSLSLLLVVLDDLRYNWIEATFQIIPFRDRNTLDIYFRAYGAFLSPISAGIFILNSLLLTSTLLLTKVIKQKIEKILLWILSIISIVAIVMTASRTSLVGLIASGLIMLVFSKSRIRLIFILLLFVTIVYQIGFLDNYIDNIALRNMDETSSGKSALEGSGRVATALNSIKLFFGERTLLFGVGPSEYSVGDGTYSMAHDGFLSLLFCHGFFGVVLFFSIIMKLHNVITKKQMSLMNISKAHFLKMYFYLFIITNAITFISSDGPVTHFWLLYLLFFIYFVENYISTAINRKKIVKVIKTMKIRNTVLWQNYRLKINKLI